LEVGDEILYITTKNLYAESYWHRRIVAHLKVLMRFDSHPKAAVWYREKIGKPPNNCMVQGNLPLPLNHTSRGTSICAPGCGSAAASLKKWNDHYQWRADNIPIFLACKTVWKELTTPTILTDQDALKILKNWERVRSRAPIEISEVELKALESLRQKRNKT